MMYLVSRNISAFTSLEIPQVYSFLFLLSAFLFGLMYLVSRNISAFTSLEIPQVYSFLFLLSAFLFGLMYLVSRNISAFTSLEIPQVYSFLFLLSAFLFGLMYLVSRNINITSFFGISVVVVCDVLSVKKEEGIVLFNDALNTFYLQLYGIRHMVRTTQIAREESHCLKLATRVLLHAPSHKQDTTYHGFCYASH